MFAVLTLKSAKTVAVSHSPSLPRTSAKPASGRRAGRQFLSRLLQALAVGAA